MFDQVFDSFRKLTESGFQQQQEMFKKWIGMWPVFPGYAPAAPEQVVKFQKKWIEYLSEVVKKQREALEAQFNAGMQHIEEAFRLAEVKEPEELRTKTLALWQKTFELLRQSFETQVRECQAAVTQWTELVTKSSAA
jgi:hypothetical protein